MINLEKSISQIERLLAEETDSSLTYAALECRLAIELVCYERLRIAHDYIAHEDLKKWQPKDVVKFLIQEVDPELSDDFTMYIVEGHPKTEEPIAADYEELDWKKVGHQAGFNANKLGKFWNALANLALHIPVPATKSEELQRYGDTTETKAKVEQVLDELRRLNRGTMLRVHPGETVQFACNRCDTKNTRNRDLLNDGQVINCINLKCEASYSYSQSDQFFVARVHEITCQKCGEKFGLHMRTMEKLRRDQHIPHNCTSCGAQIFVDWQIMSGQSD